MFNGTRISQLEARVGALEKRVEELDRLSQKQNMEIEALIRRVDALVDEMVIAHLDGESYHELLQERGDFERAETLLRVKNGYEKKLRRFIRNTTSKKRMVQKPVADGKETPEAAE